MFALFLLFSLLQARAQNQPELSVQVAESAKDFLTSLSNALILADWPRAEAAKKNLQAMGPEVIPQLMFCIKHGEGSRGYRSSLVDVIAKVGVQQESTSALVELGLTVADTNIAHRAAAWLGNRVIDCEIPDDYISPIIAQIAGSNAIVAARWAYLAARATRLDASRIVLPLIERLKRAVLESEKQSDEPASDSYLSARVRRLNGFVRVFQFVSSSVSIPALRSEVERSQDGPVRLWLTIALGMTGDETAGPELLELVESAKEDSSTRAVALRAYGHALGQKSLPVLERYKADKTPGPKPTSPPISVVARSTLAELERPQPK
jgi:HEAT repeat protein